MDVWKLRRSSLTLRARGTIMGILNVTPDSFSDGGQYAQPEAALEHARQLIAEGADIIDLGGESARPGSRGVKVEEEQRRVLPALRRVRQSLPSAIISVDTRHPEVARLALEAGADIINDVGGLGDRAMREVCAEFRCGVVLMHMQGEPSSMQLAPYYEDVVREVRDFFQHRIRLAHEAGIELSRICLDPGIGFGKTAQHNLTLIRHLEEVRCEGLPILVGLSRKSFLDQVDSDTVQMSLEAAQYGAQIHRVHDVAALRAALTLRYPTTSPPYGQR